MTLRLTILGCGSSGGVPRIAEGWGACDPANPKNRRRRCSVLLESLGQGGATTVLVDTSPDLREQLIDVGVKRLDGVLMSHPHADHTHGIDDLRPLCLAMRRPLDIYMNETTSLRVTDAFAYIFHTPEGSSYPPIAREHAPHWPDSSAASRGRAERSRRRRSISHTATSTRLAFASARSPIPPT